MVGVAGEDVKFLTSNNTMSTTKMQSLRCDDWFFVQYCTVDDVLLREWPNLNLRLHPLESLGYFDGHRRRYVRGDRELKGTSCN